MESPTPLPYSYCVAGVSSIYNMIITRCKKLVTSARRVGQKVLTIAISLLCIISKVLEHLIFSKISKFIITNNILYHHQFGFRQYHSTIQQLLIFLSDILSALNVPNVMLFI